MTEWLKPQQKVKKERTMVDKPPVVRLTPEQQRGHGRLKKGECPAGAYVITKENSMAMHRRRWQLAQERAAEGMMEAVNEANERLAIGGKHIPKGTPVEAFKYIVKHATSVYLNSKSPKGMSDLGSFIASKSGMAREIGEVDKQSDNLPLAGLEDAKFILQVFNNYYQTKLEDVIDAEVIG